MGMLAGLLVDVSGSMKSSLQLNARPEDTSITRMESVFRTINNIAQREVKENVEHEIFVLGFGLISVPTCDLLALLENTESLNSFNSRGGRIDGKLELTQLLADHGAPNASKYIYEYVTEDQAGFLYQFYSQNIQLLRQVVADLPEACKGSFTGYATRRLSSTASFLDFVGIAAPKNLLNEKEETATKDQVKEAMVVAMERILELREITKPVPKSLKTTIDLLHKVSGSSEQKQLNLTSEQLAKLVSAIQPFIYGGTPMCESLRLSIDLFHKTNHNQKAMFMISDGDAADGDPKKYIRNLQNASVQVYSCLLTDKNISEPKRLFDRPESSWSNAQRNMFELSSTVDNSHSAMAILIEQGWKLPESGQSRLFIQANHPEVIDEFTNLFHRVTHNNDALLNLFARAKLDEYINSSISTCKPNTQVGGTCYANAVAAVLHLAMFRITGRQGGVPAFKDLLNELIRVYGSKGANTKSVLDKYSQKYRLHYQEVDESGARQAINARRPVVATFCLYHEQWLAFGNFYKKYPKGILESNHLATKSTLTKPGGHAVVLLKCDPTSLTFLNSWGKNFADGGLFRVKNQAVLDLKFYDVYWTLKDLLPQEIRAYDEKKNEIGGDFLEGLPDSVKNLPYECPWCTKTSPAIEFKGHLLEATCPKCNQNFVPAVIGLAI